MAEETLRIGIIGAGGIVASRHVPGFKAQEDVEIVGVVNRSAASSQRAAEQFDIPRVYGDWLEMVEDDDVDAIVIGTWPYMHSTLTLAALEAGKHVLCQARMAMNATEANEMLAASRGSPDLIAQVVPAPQTMSIERAVADMISDGYVGDIINVRAQLANSSAFPVYDNPVHWRHDRDLSGNNTMHIGIWYENLMRWVGQASSVQALGQTVVKHRLDAQGDRQELSIPDHLEIICQLAGGGTLSMTMTEVSGLARPLEISIHGTDGTLVIDSTDSSKPGAPALRVLGGKNGAAQTSEIEIPEENRGIWRVEEEFVNAIRGIEPVTRTNFTDGVKYMEFTDAVTEARLTGDIVHLPM